MASQNNNSKDDKSDQTDWRLKLSDLVQTCQSELKKTTKIGMKMISASQATTELHESYEEVGRWLVEKIKAGELEIDDVRVEGLISKIDELEAQLKSFEDEVQDIKKT